MAKYSRYIRLLKKLISLISILLIYGALIQINSFCKAQSGKVKFCNLVYSLAKPQNSFTKGAIDLRKFLLTSSTSRVLSTNIEESRKRFSEY